MRRITPLALGLALLATWPLAPEATAQEVTGLSGWTLYLDPGHSGTNENVGIYGYSEPEKVLRIGLALKEMLEQRTDIEAVFISRENDQVQVGLSQRSDEANALGVDFFHSIHSNAGAPSTNNTLMLHGGWRRNGQTVEKTPAGGKRMGDEFIETLTAAMRIPTIGNFADRTFYQGFPENHQNQFPFLSVNRRTNMASVLSEGGFHTNPRQNTLNMNADWKRLEAQAHFWGILQYHGLPRTPDRIATGILSDAENGRPINGATIEIAGRTYTTDTFESLFNEYSNVPGELRNGFYYLEDMPAGTHAATVTAPGYRGASGEVTLLEGEFTFADFELVSNVPPVVTVSAPAPGQNPFPVTDPIVLEFSRPMDRAATEAAFSVTPEAAGEPVAGTFRWSEGDTRLTFTPQADLAAQTAFTLTLAGTAEGAAGDPFDGDADGTGGDAFQIAFTTGFPDTVAPTIVSASPRPNASGVGLRPILTLTFSEPLDSATVDGRLSLSSSAGDVPGQVQYATVGERSVISFFPSEDLRPDTRYRLEVSPGLRDLFLNEQEGTQATGFNTGSLAASATPIDGFEADVADNWWLPQQSGSTTGIETGETASGATDEIASLRDGGGASFSLEYGWNVSGGAPWLIRQYLAGGPPRSVFFSASGDVLRAAVFGDGSGTLFRFAVDDGGPGGHEVSPWIPIDWRGWQTVEWDFDADGTGTWIGNGVFDGSLRFDSFQLAYDPGAPSAQTGQIWIDDLEVVQFVSVDGEATPEAPAPLLSEAFPNPVRGAATLRLTLAAPESVTATVYSATGAEVARLASGEAYGAGEHALRWDAGGVASGVYFVRVQAGAETATARLTVVR